MKTVNGRVPDGLTLVSVQYGDDNVRFWREFRAAERADEAFPDDLRPLAGSHEDEDEIMIPRASSMAAYRYLQDIPGWDKYDNRPLGFVPCPVGDP